MQLPVFVTAMWASRRMALAPWPGLEAGGALWFPDLTVSALDLASQTAQVRFLSAVQPLSSMNCACSTNHHRRCSCRFFGITT